MIKLNNQLTPELHTYDVVIVNTSAGKDSMACMGRVVNECKAQGFPLSKVVAVHADLGRVEWEGCPELAGKHAKHYGLRFELVKHARLDLLDRIEERGAFPDPARRWCTSDFKRAPIRKLMTKLANEIHGNKRSSNKSPSKLGRPVRMLNCMGMRAQESSARAKLKSFSHSHANSRREVNDWLPVHSWKEDEVWDWIRKSNLEWHKAYDYGMPRLSCAFCIFASRDALLIAAEHNYKLLEQYVEVEEKIGHTFRKNLPIVDIKTAYDNGERGNADKCKSCPWAA